MNIGVVPYLPAGPPALAAAVLPPPSLYAPVVPVPGVPGAAGGATFPAVAATVLSGHRVVRATPTGTVTYASATVQADAAADVFLTAAAADAGAAVDLYGFGYVTEPSWSWTPGPVWLGVNGTLTQTPPTTPAAAYLRQIGTADGPTGLFYNPRPAFVLA